VTSSTVVRATEAVVPMQASQPASIPIHYMSFSCGIFNRAAAG